MDILKDLAVTLLQVSLTPIVVALGALLGKLILEGIKHIKNVKLQSFAWIAVQWVEQKFKTLNSQDKFDKAYEAIAKKFPGVEADDIEKAIESAVHELTKIIPNA